MAGGFIVYDVLFLVFATAFYGGALAAGVRVFQVLSAHLPWPLAVVPALYTAVAVLIVEVFVATSLCPRIEPGRYPMKGKIFFSWLLRSLFRRLLLDCGLKWLVFSSNVLRFFALRALGAKVHFTASISSDVAVLDPALFDMQAGAMLGSRCLVSGHFLDRGSLVLARVQVGEGALMAVSVHCGPGVTIGRRSVVKANTSISMNAVIGDDVDVGPYVFVDTGAKIGNKAKIASRAHVGRKQVIEEGASFP
jgi:acetyltransferase-like isoleucine patch superfamily enzyme